MAVGRRAVMAGLSTLFAECSATGGERPPLKLANDVDLDRYFGRWYIIANIPYFAERGNMGTFVEYAHMPDGQIADVYYAHEHGFASPLTRREGRAYVVPGSNNALWRVTFLGPIYVSYPIIHVEADYRTALVGYPDRSLGWVFSRDRHMDDAIYRDLLKRFAAQGYDTSQFKPGAAAALNVARRLLHRRPPVPPPGYATTPRDDGTATSTPPLACPPCLRT